jgi:hypothetical protein
VSAWAFCPGPARRGWRSPGRSITPSSKFYTTSQCWNQVLCRQQWSFAAYHSSPSIAAGVPPIAPRPRDDERGTTDSSADRPQDRSWGCVQTRGKITVGPTGIGVGVRGVGEKKSFLAEMLSKLRFFGTS